MCGYFEEIMSIFYKCLVAFPVFFSISKCWNDPIWRSIENIARIYQFCHLRLTYLPFGRTFILIFFLRKLFCDILSFTTQWYTFSIDVSSSADEGIYNTYIIDTDYKSWALIMHCAEKTKDPPRYLSALLLSREQHLGINVINFLR